MSVTMTPEPADSTASTMHTDERRVYIVDDDPAVRSSLCWLIESVNLQPKAFGSAAEFLAAYDPEPISCLILDVRLPGMSGLELQEHLLANHIRVPTIVVTGHGEVSMAVRALKAGAVNFFEKPFSDQALLDEIQRTLEREQRTRQTRLRRGDIRARIGRLTPRELEVMNLVVDGMANKQIAADLGLSEKTVEIHRARVMEKTESRSLAHLVKMVLDSRAADDA